MGLRKGVTSSIPLSLSLSIRQEIVIRKVVASARLPFRTSVLRVLFFFFFLLCINLMSNVM